MTPQPQGACVRSGTMFRLKLDIPLKHKSRELLDRIRDLYQIQRIRDSLCYHYNYIVPYEYGNAYAYSLNVS